ncbi:hypothetical protein R3P38DRAFT_1282973 [Favolaschia claudopus]|uniref:Uncharacterized protein n=1 Tax=Favolaschia claudopus TaxID=2862362 RepID=A0AAW0B2E4_9AGAR
MAYYAQRSYNYPHMPYNGPPPKPSHIRVNQQDWQNGSWVMNPAYNPSSKWAGTSSQGWVPSQAWHQQRQQEWAAMQQHMAANAAHNPYKRQPRPPSAEYLATRLVDNPLGLTNMVPRDQLYGPSNEEGLAAATPWIWNPRDLNPDAGPSSTDNQAAEPASSRRPAQASTLQTAAPPSANQHSTPTRRTSQAPSPSAAVPPHSAPAAAPITTMPLSPPRMPSPPPGAQILTSPHGYGSQPPRPPQQRERTEPAPPTQHRNTLPTRHSSEPPADVRPSSSTDTLPPLDRPLDRPRQYQRSSAYQPETFTASRDLQPTFSSNIVRTPQHYKSRSSSVGPSPPPQPLYGPPTSRNSFDAAQLTSRMEQLSTQPMPNALSRHSSLPQPLTAQSTGGSITSVGSFVEEPASILSPLLLPVNEQRHHKHSSRALRAHSSVPTVPASSSLSAIPEGSSGDPNRRSPHQSPPQAQESQRRSRHTSPATPGPQLTVTPPRSNPLPDPPQEWTRHPSMGLPVQRTPPSSYRAAVRKGFWNRRGDHLTVDGFVVYAPVVSSYPDELKEYPAETVGYRDHMGMEVPYIDRPELPASLPRFGQPPREPYEKFIVYEYLQ